MKKTIKQPTEKLRRGFAVIEKSLGRRIASLGGKAVSKNRKYMRDLGRRGGIASGAAKRKAVTK